MNALWETHAFLWWITDDPRLSPRVRAIADDPQRCIPDQLARNATDVLPVQLAHALRVLTLPDLHTDPFDRMLVAQAQVEGLPILTADPQIARYPVEVIW